MEMISTIIHIGDCNTPTTYQVLMNFLFSSYLGQWMDVDLDDIVVYLSTIAEHMEQMEHVNTILDILK